MKSGVPPFFSLYFCPLNRDETITASKPKRESERNKMASPASLGLRVENDYLEAGDVS